METVRDVSSSHRLPVFHSSSLTAELSTDSGPPLAALLGSYGNWAFQLAAQIISHQTFPGCLSERVCMLPTESPLWVCEHITLPTCNMEYNHALSGLFRVRQQSHTQIHEHPTTSNLASALRVAWTHETSLPEQRQRLVHTICIRL